MNENFLMENPLQLFEDFKNMPDEAFEYSGEEIVSVVDAVVESSDYIKVLAKLYEKNPTEIETQLNNFKIELAKARNNQFPEKKKNIVEYFMEKNIDILTQIISYRGAFKKIPLKVTKLDPDVKLPFYSDPGDAGMDICSNATIDILPHQTVVIPTGIKVIVPGGYELQIRPRSGLSLKTGLRIANSPGTIDSGYRKEVGVIVENTSNLTITINKYDRIAQFCLKEIPHIVWEEINEEEYSSYNTNRGDGFGSSGVATN